MFVSTFHISYVICKTTPSLNILHSGWRREQAIGGLPSSPCQSNHRSYGIFSIHVMPTSCPISTAIMCAALLSTSQSPTHLTVTGHMLFVRGQGSHKKSEGHYRPVQFVRLCIKEWEKKKMSRASSWQLFLDRRQKAGFEWWDPYPLGFFLRLGASPRDPHCFTPQRLYSRPRFGAFLDPAWQSVILANWKWCEIYVIALSVCW